MKKKVFAVLLSAVMTTALLSGCNVGRPETVNTSGGESAAKKTETGSSASGSVEEITSSGKKNGSDDKDEDAAVVQFEGLKANSAYDFPIIVKSFQSTYWQAALQGMDKAASELGVTYKALGTTSESEIAEQVNMLNTEISARPAGIGLAACDATSVIPALQQCADQGIPVVAFDSGVADAPDGSVVCTVATDNGAAGAVAADHVYAAIRDTIEKADRTVRIGEVNQDTTALNIQQRGLGFINEMIRLIQEDGKTVSVEGNAFYVNAAEGADRGETDVIIEVAVPAQTTVEFCAAEAQTLFSKSDTIAIFGSNQTSTEGILAANVNFSVLGSDAKSGDVIAAGFDAGSTIKAAVQDGTLYGAVTQSPLMMGYYTIYALAAAANGSSIEDVSTAGYWYDADNMNDPSIAPNLYD
jgi:ribose transport system substrate-binding protein